MQLRGLFADAWRLWQSITLGDALYVALAKHLNAPILTDDLRLVRAPGLPVDFLHLEGGARDFFRVSKTSALVAREAPFAQVKPVLST